MNWNWMMIWNENECRKKTKEMRISRQPSPLQTITDQTQLENVAYSNYFGNITNDTRCTHGIKPRTAMAKAAFNRKKTFFYQQTWLKPKKKNQWNATFGVQHCMVLKLWHFGQQIRNTWKVSKCGAGEGYKRSAGPIVWEMRKCYTQSRRRKPSPTINRKKANWIGHILRRNYILKLITQGNTERGI